MLATSRIYAGGSPLKQIQLALGHTSIATTERYLGGKLNLADAACDRLGIQPYAGVGDASGGERYGGSPEL